MSRKGLSLPIEMIVIVAIAVLVLVVIAAFFIGGMKPLDQISEQQALQKGCIILKTTENCAGNDALLQNIIIPGYRPSGATVDSNLYKACENNGYPGWIKCKAACGC